LISTLSFLTLPVEIEIRDDLPGSRARYVGIKDGAHHILVQTKHVTPFVLAHELVHALQCERDWNCDFDAMLEDTQAKLAAALNLTRSQVEAAWVLSAMVRREKRRGLTRTLDTYNNMPWEREANERALA